MKLARKGSALRVTDEDSRELKRSQAVARIAGVNIPTKKRVEIALTYIHGIGTTSAKKICAKAGVPDERRVNDLSEEENYNYVINQIDIEFKIT